MSLRRLRPGRAFKRVYCVLQVPRYLLLLVFYRNHRLAVWLYAPVFHEAFRRELHKAAEAFCGYFYGCARIFAPRRLYRGARAPARPARRLVNAVYKFCQIAGQRRRKRFVYLFKARRYRRRNVVRAFKKKIEKVGVFRHFSVARRREAVLHLMREVHQPFKAHNTRRAF